MFDVKAERVFCAALLYGDFHSLHTRILDSFKKAMPREVKLHIWCNTVCQQTKDYLVGWQKEFPNATVTDSAQNIPKYKVMRHLAAEVTPDKYDWFVWFDDDSYIVHKDWFRRVQEFIKPRAKENVCCLGKIFFIHRADGMGDFIAASTWYKGVPPVTYPNRSRQRAPAARFATGGYWWLRVDVMKLLDWPDVRLNHNGGDTLLGEALHQNGFRIHGCDYGVLINKAKRRGYSEKRAGAK